MTKQQAKLFSVITISLAMSLLMSICGVPGNAAGSAASDHSSMRILIAMSEEVRGICQQAEQLINSRQFADAEQLLHRAGKIDPNCAEVHGYLGMCYQNNLKTKEAIDEYLQALRLSPQMSFINVNLGTCYMNSGQLDQAVPYFQKYLQENPNAPDAAQVQGYIQQAGARQGQQNLRGAVEQGQALLNQHKYNEAIAAFRQAIAQQPGFAPSHFYLGFALSQSGQNQEAITEFQNCLQIDPSMKEAVLNIGSNYQSFGDCANAISWYERYLSQSPGSTKAGEIKQRINGLRQQMQTQGHSASREGGGIQGNPPGSGIASGFPQASLAGSSTADYFLQACPNGKCFRWQRMPIRVYIAPGAGTPGYRDSFVQFLMEAFSTWAKGADNRLAFMLSQDPSQCDILCEWTGDPNKVVEAGRAVEGGLTKLSAQPQPNGDLNIISARVILLCTRGGTGLSDDDMKKVCLHELGHVLGINGHSSDNHDIMFFSESATVWPALTKRDKATISRIYANYPRIATP